MITVIQNKDLYIIHFKYDPDIITLVKQVTGRRYDANHKYWTIPVDKLGLLINQFRGTPYEYQIQVYSAEYINENATLDATKKIPDIDLSGIPLYVKDGEHLFQHQLDFMKYAIDRQRRGITSGFILADQPGCIAGDMKVRIQESGKSYTRDCTLANAYKLYRKGVQFRIKTMSNGRFVYMPVKEVAYTGVKRVVKLSAGSYELVCTPDHQIYSERGWIEVENLHVGDKVYLNGDYYTCPMCGTSENIITYKYSKFRGLCKSCMYRSRNGSKYKDDEIHKVITKDGYVMLLGVPIRTSPLYTVHSKGHTGGVLEHHYVWYQHTGHIIDTTKEVIHHKNHIRTDNRIENLELMLIQEHMQLHTDVATANLPQNITEEFYYCKGHKTWVVPHLIEITSIQNFDETHVYDVSIDHPDIHNFVANNFIVHNCGKTLEAMNLALYNQRFNNVKHCLIIACVNSAKYNWIYDIEKHTNGKHKPYLLGSRMKRNGTIRLEGSSADKLQDLMIGRMYSKAEGDPLPFFLVINIEAFHYRQKRRYPIRERLTTLLNKGYISMVILDECHRGLSPTSKQGRQVLQLKEDTAEAKVEWLPMTGTPIVNKPTDVFSPLKLVDGHRYTNYMNWCQHFCIYGDLGTRELLAYKNIPELKRMLQGNMLRRLKSEVLDLPPKIHTIEYVENTPYQEKLYQGIVEDTLAHKAEILSAPNPVVKFLRLRQVTGSPEIVDKSLVVNKAYLTKNAKMARLLDLVDTIISCGEKVIIYSNWVEPLRTMYKFLAVKNKVCVFTGTMKPEDCEKNKQMFIQDPDHKIIIGTIGKLGVSHTLNVANNIIFYDLPWNPAIMTQAEDRGHRPGTVSTVNIYCLISRGSADEQVYNIIVNKDGISKYIVDDELSFENNPELFDLLLRGGI